MSAGTPTARDCVVRGVVWQHHEWSCALTCARFGKTLKQVQEATR